MIDAAPPLSPAKNLQALEEAFDAVGRVILHKEDGVDLFEALRRCRALGYCIADVLGCGDGEIITHWRNITVRDDLVITRDTFDGFFKKGIWCALMYIQSHDARSFEDRIRMEARPMLEAFFITSLYHPEFLTELSETVGPQILAIYKEQHELLEENHAAGAIMRIEDVRLFQDFGEDILACMEPTSKLRRCAHSLNVDRYMRWAYAQAIGESLSLAKFSAGNSHAVNMDIAIALMQDVCCDLEFPQGDDSIRMAFQAVVDVAQYEKEYRHDPFLISVSNGVLKPKR